MHAIAIKSTVPEGCDGRENEDNVLLGRRPPLLRQQGLATPEGGPALLN